MIEWSASLIGTGFMHFHSVLCIVTTDDLCVRRRYLRHPLTSTSAHKCECVLCIQRLCVHTDVHLFVCMCIGCPRSYECACAYQSTWPITILFFLFTPDRLAEHRKKIDMTDFVFFCLSRFASFILSVHLTQAFFDQFNSYSKPRHATHRLNKYTICVHIEFNTRWKVWLTSTHNLSICQNVTAPVSSTWNHYIAHYLILFALSNPFFDCPHSDSYTSHISINHFRFFAMIVRDDVHLQNKAAPF